VSNLDELFNNQALELRRGAIVLAVLACFTEALYGYSLVQKLEKSGFAVEAGTLYPLLRRLEKQGLLASKWNTDDTRPRKYYSLSNKGKEFYNKLLIEWTGINKNLQKIIKKAKTK
jgi:PadR family transcriptional regulator, regulatory protein PadR